MMRVGIAADHGGFTLKGELAELLSEAGYEVVDFGAHQRSRPFSPPASVVPYATNAAWLKCRRSRTRKLGREFLRRAGQTRRPERPGHWRCLPDVDSGASAQSRKG
jgi:hypothetical protein